MTKQVRIENADTSSYKVVVIVEERVYDPAAREQPDEWREVNRVVLAYPTELTTQYITDTRRIRIEEAR